MQTFTSGLQQKGARLANPLLFSHTYVNTPTSLCAIEFSLGGHHGSFAGQGAGQAALWSAIEALQLGRADLLLAIGVDALSEPQYRALVAEGALTAPIGEGACAVVLETADFAHHRGVTGHPLADIPTDARLRTQLGNTFAAEPFLLLAATSLYRLAT
jgi:3-oxoacyl-(acyl-carrier-protein) synthase